MAIFVHTTGLSMANTCQLPLLTPTGRKVLAGCVNWQFGFDVRQSWTIRAVLHNHTLVSTGCAQKRNAFGLREWTVRCKV
jgi:hypothetical protein